MAQSRAGNLTFDFKRFANSRTTVKLKLTSFFHEKNFFLIPNVLLLEGILFMHPKYAIPKN